MPATFLSDTNEVEYGMVQPALRLAHFEKPEDCGPAGHAGAGGGSAGPSKPSISVGIKNRMWDRLPGGAAGAGGRYLGTGSEILSSTLHLAEQLILGNTPRVPPLRRT